MFVRPARPGEGGRIQELLQQAVLSAEDDEDVSMWCAMLDTGMRSPVTILVCEKDGRVMGAVVSKLRGLLCRGTGEEQIELINDSSVYVPFLAVDPKAGFGCGKMLGEAAISEARAAGQRMLIVLIHGDRLYRYYRHLWPEGIYFEPGSASFFLRLALGEVLFPEIFHMDLAPEYRLGIMPLREGIELKELGDRRVVVGAVEDYDASHLGPPEGLKDLLRRLTHSV